MRVLLTIPLILVLCFCQITPILGQDVVFLTNQDVLTMVKAKLPSALIIEKINNSSCNFDTFPSVLAELKYKGVPDDVLVAMVRAPHGTRVTPNQTHGSRSAITRTETQPAFSGPITIPDGTPLEVEVVHTISSGEVEEGSAISFAVVHPVKISGVTVINRGARATARVTKAKKGGSWGRAGSLAWMMQDVIAVDGSKVPLQFNNRSKGDSKGGTVATAMVVTGLIFLPAAPLWGFKKGKDAKIPAGRRFDVIVHGDSTINIGAKPEDTGGNE